MVRAGDSLTFDVQGETGGFVPVDDTDLTAAVNDQLAQHFQVVRNDLTRGSAFSNIVTGQWLHWSYTAVVTVRLRGDYGSPADVGSIIANAFYNAGGAIPAVTSRELGESAGTGITTTGPDFGSAIDDLIASTSEGIGNAGRGLGEGLAGLFKPLTELATQTEWLIVGGLVLIVALIVFSPAGRAAGRSVGNIRAV